MGGENSGRRPGADAILNQMAPRETIRYDAPEEQLVLPNYSGLKPEVLKTNPTPITPLWTATGTNIYNSNTGNVGIGTTSPTAKLEVNTTIGGNQLRLTDGGTGNGVGARWYSSSGALNWQVATQYTGSGFEITPSTAAGGSTFSTPALFIDSSSRVGIGTISPTELLHIGGGAGATPTIRLGNTGAGIGAEIERDVSAGQLNFDVQTANTAVNYYQFKNDGTTKVVIDGTGNVGIGTTSPQRKLHLNESSASTVAFQITNSVTGATATSDGLQLLVDGSGNGALWNYENTNLSFGTNNNDRLFIAAGGNVGIGTTNPASKLEVSGGNVAVTNGVFKINASGGITANVTSADLVGKTMQFSGGLLIGYQ